HRRRDGGRRAARRRGRLQPAGGRGPWLGGGGAREVARARARDGDLARGGGARERRAGGGGGDDADGRRVAAGALGGGAAVPVADGGQRVGRGAAQPETLPQRPAGHRRRAGGGNGAGGPAREGRGTHEAGVRRAAAA